MLRLASEGEAAARQAGDDFWFGPVPGSGGHVGNPMQILVFFACVRVLAETVGSLPVPLYRRLPGGGKERVRSEQHPAAQVVGVSPNGVQTSLEWREQLQAHAAARGNGYSRVEFDSMGRPLALWPMHPDRTRVELLANGRLSFVHHDDAGGERRYTQDQVLRISGLAMDGYLGLNPVEAHRRTLGLAQSSTSFANRFFDRDLVQGGWIEHPTNFKDDETRNGFLARVRRMLQDGKLPLFEYGTKYHDVGIKMTDAQFLEQRKYSAVEICQMFRMPPHKVQILDQAKWANIEQQSIDFVTDTMLPWLRRWEARLNHTLLTDDEQPFLFFEFNVEALLRGDSAARAAFYDKMLRAQVLVPNEVRELENRNPRAGGDEPLPLANQSLGPGTPGAEPDGRAARIEQRNAEVVVGKELNQVRALVKKHGEGPALSEALTAFYGAELRPLLEKVLDVPAAVSQRYALDSLDLLSRANGSMPELLKNWERRRAAQLLETIHA